MYFLGLFNLMFNWGHHIYTLPTEKYIRYIGYAVSMTEWIFFIKIFYQWKKSVSTIQKNYHYFPYRFLMAADLWVFLNMAQAILMSIPAINIYTHGTHVTVAHAMGTTIGINSMILLAACFEFSNVSNQEKTGAAPPQPASPQCFHCGADSASSGAAMLGHDFRRQGWSDPPAAGGCPFRG